MDANEFIELLENPGKVEKKGVEELKKLSLEYPYSQAVQLLYTIRLSQSSEYLFNRQLGKTSILTDDRSLLFDLFEKDNEENFSESEELSLDEKLEKEYNITPPEPEDVEVEEEKEAVQIGETLKAEAEREDDKAAEAESIEEPEEDEEIPEETTEEEKPDLSHLSASERIQYILEENRRLREEFTAKKSATAATETPMEQRIREIRERSKELNAPASEKIPEQKTEEILEEKIAEDKAVEEIPDPQEIIADNEPHAVIDSDVAEHDVAEKKEDKPLATEEIIESEPEPVEEPIFTIEEDVPGSKNEEPESVPEVQRFDGPADGEAHSFSDWLERLKNNSGEGKDTGTTNIFTATEKPGSGKNIQKIQLFDSFVEKLPELKRKKIDRAKTERPLIDMTNIMNDEEDSMVTETLAKVYLRQKHYDKAIKAYEIMKLKYPEKSSFFADQISEIRKLINSK